MPDLVPSRSVFGRTMEPSAMLDRAWHDCLYLAAIDENRNVPTADRKFFEAVTGSLHRNQVELFV